MLFSVKWTQFYLEEKAMRAISLFHHLWITLQRGAVWKKGRHQDFKFTFLFSA